MSNDQEDGGLDVEAMTDTVEQCLTGDSGFILGQLGFGIVAYSDLGEIYLRTPGGSHFKMTVEAISSENIENSGVEFD